MNSSPERNSKVMSHIMNTVSRLDITVLGAHGLFLETTAGDLMDLFTDTGTVNLGYRPPELMDAIASIPQHVPNSLRIGIRSQAAEALCARTRMDNVFFSNSGTESVEAAIKIVRKYIYNTGRADKRKIIYTEKGGFHGRTYASMMASDGPPYHTEGFGPHITGFKHFSDPSEIQWDECAGVLVATIDGNNDVILPVIDHLWTIREMTTKHSIPLVLDEVQCGCGRTGMYNAYDIYGIKPDIVCMAKGVAAGIPTGVTLACGEFSSVLQPGMHYSTFGGSPLSCAGILYAQKTIDSLLVGGMPHCHVSTVGQAVLNVLSGHKEFIFNVRGIGLWYAFDVFNNKAREFCNNLVKHGVYCVTFRDHAAKFTPMLTTTMEDVEYIKQAFSAAVHDTFLSGVK